MVHQKFHGKVSLKSILKEFLKHIYLDDLMTIKKNAWTSQSCADKLTFRDCVFNGDFTSQQFPQHASIKLQNCSKN